MLIGLERFYNDCYNGHQGIHERSYNNEFENYCACNNQENNRVNIMVA